MSVVYRERSVERTSFTALGLTLLMVISVILMLANGCVRDGKSQDAGPIHGTNWAQLEQVGNTLIQITVESGEISLCEWNAGEPHLLKRVKCDIDSIANKLGAERESPAYLNPFLAADLDAIVFKLPLTKLYPSSDEGHYDTKTVFAFFRISKLLATGNSSPEPDRLVIAGIPHRQQWINGFDADEDKLYFLDGYRYKVGPPPHRYPYEHITPRLLAADLEDPSSLSEYPLEFTVLHPTENGELKCRALLVRWPIVYLAVGNTGQDFFGVVRVDLQEKQAVNLPLPKDASVGLVDMFMARLHEVDGQIQLYINNSLYEATSDGLTLLWRKEEESYKSGYALSWDALAYGGSVVELDMTNALQVHRE